jgi:hypothetical protein
MSHNDSEFRKKKLQDLKDAKFFKHGYMANMSLVLLTLHDKFDFSKEELEDLIDETAELLDSYNKDFLSFEDICVTLFEETGITVK